MNYDRASVNPRCTSSQFVYGLVYKASAWLPGQRLRYVLPANRYKKRVDERTRTAYPCSSYE
jgi:hypothetical protein